jgi:hypothetical protein
MLPLHVYGGNGVKHSVGEAAVECGAKEASKFKAEAPQGEPADGSEDKPDGASIPGRSKRMKGMK